MKLGQAREYAFDMALIHISETDAINDFASVLARGRAGEEIVIESNRDPVALVRPAAARTVRLLSESLKRARGHGSTVTLDGDFAGDLEDIIGRHPEPLNPPAWD
jgi:antitoxin (DNA-binding transcriptional repressor) of toxin-antitoxin stability system